MLRVQIRSCLKNSDTNFKYHIKFYDKNNLTKFIAKKNMDRYYADTLINSWAISWRLIYPFL